jgi:O-antigen/teichoic acid export membrane protein
MKTSIKILKYGLPVLGIQTLNMLMFPVVKIIMANTLGVVSVGIFELATKVAYSLRTFFEKGLFALMPEFSKLHKLNDRGSSEILLKKVSNFTKKLMYFGVPLFVTLALCSPFLLKLWLNKAYDPEILQGYLLLQPGIIVGLLALPSYYALLATKNQKICFYEAVIRTILTFIIILVLFLALPLNSIVIYTAISLSVVFSNFYLMYSFRKKIKHV